MNRERKQPPDNRSERIFTGAARLIVGLMWALLVVMVVVVAYLAGRFYG